MNVFKRKALLSVSTSRLYIYSPQLDPLTCNAPFGIGCPGLRSFEISPREMSVFTECDGARRLLVLTICKIHFKNSKSECTN